MARRIKDALTALWDASDRVCGRRLKVIDGPDLATAPEKHGRLQLGQSDRDRVDHRSPSRRCEDRGGRRRHAGFYSAIMREVPDPYVQRLHQPGPGFCEVDMVAHGGTWVAGSFIQTLTMVDVATG